MMFGKEYTQLEKSVLNKLLIGNDPVLKSLYSQFKHSKIQSREFSGKGFFLNLMVDKKSKSLTETCPYIKNKFCFGDVGAIVNQSQEKLGFLLWIENGQLDMLECYAYKSHWPKTIDSFELYYYSSPRDILKLQKKWEEITF